MMIKIIYTNGAIAIVRDGNGREQTFYREKVVERLEGEANDMIMAIAKARLRIAEMEVEKLRQLEYLKEEWRMMSMVERCDREMRWL